MNTAAPIRGHRTAPAFAHGDERWAGGWHARNDPLVVRARLAWAILVAMAGWYSTISVSPVVPCMDGSMWDRPAAVPGQGSCLVTASFLDQNRSAVDVACSVRQRLDALESARWIFVGVTSDDTGNAVGFVAMADEAPSDIQRNALALLRAVGITDPTIRSQLWRRGGRPA